MIVRDLERIKPGTPFDAYLGFKATADAALVDLDKVTDLLNHDEFADGKRIPDILRRKRKPVPDKLQWPIVTALRSSNLRPMTTLWLALKPNALPEPILRGWVRDTGEYLAERALTQSMKAWEIVDVLKQLSKSARLAVLDKLPHARDIAKQIYAGAQNEHQRSVALALFSLLNENFRDGMINAVGFAVDGRKALRVRDDGAVVVALATRLRKLCEKALDKHPQKDLLKQQI